MNNYLKLILKKQQYIERLQKELDKLQEIQNGFSSQKIRFKLLNEDLKEQLEELSYYDKEENICFKIAVLRIVLLLLSIVFFLISLEFGAPLFYSIIGIIIFNLINILGTIGISRILSFYFDERRRENRRMIDQTEIAILQLRKDKEAFYQNVTLIEEKKKSLLEEKKKEQNSLIAISNSVIYSLMQLDQNHQLERLNLLLDQLIEKEINKDELGEIDIHLQRKLNHLENK